MGKKGGGNSSSNNKKGGGGNNNKSPKCICDHPYQCSCGNRPERPSKGHKWDPETQQWGGKGHKQKGASGQTASIGKEATTTTVGKTKIEQWQKLPTDILMDWCKKQKRPYPKYKELLNDHTKQTFKVRVILRDAKTDRDKDLMFVPRQEVDNEEQAKEEAALLALLQLTPTLPHERKLPEPYKTTWLNAIQSMKEDSKSSNRKNTNSNDTTDNNKASSKSNSKNSGGSGASSSSNLSAATSFASAAERRRHAEVKRQERNARVRKHEAVRMANRDHPVFLSARLRKQIQSLLRGDVSIGSAGGTNNDDDDDENDETLNVFETDLQCYVEERLHHEGFTKRQARNVFNKHKKPALDKLDEDQWENIYEECLQWLCVHLDEDQLPEGFDPRGSTLEVVAPTKINVTESESKKVDNDSKSSASPAVAAMASRFGITIRDAIWLQDQKTKHDQMTVEQIFWDRICELSGVQLDSAVGPSARADNSNNDAMVTEEIEAIEAIFPDECQKSNDEQRGTSTVVLKTPEGVDMNFTFDKLYPGSFPLRVLFLGKWPSPVGVAFHVEIMKHISTLPLGEPMMFELYGQSQTLLQTLDELPKDTLLSPIETTVPKTETTSSVQTNKSLTSAPQTDPSTKSRPEQSIVKKRPRARGSFWTNPPEKTKQAKSFGWSTTIENQRKALPAWKARDDFLSILDGASKSSRVVLVTGDTGCGKTTQIPQFILEENPKAAKIVVAQPRRLAATGVAGRVAEERGESRPGEGSVGYVVRGDTALCDDTRLLFCTFGILLRQLQSDGALDSISHIVIDEVHERNLDGDILMGLLRDSLKSNPHLTVILMSATLDAERFAAYWDNAPRIHIPGRTFPVQDFLLEDVLERTGYNPPKKRRKQGRFGQGNWKSSNRKSTPWDDSEKSDNEDDEDDDDDAEDGDDRKVSKTSPNGGTLPSLEERVKRVDQESVDYHLLGQLVKHIVQSKEMGDGSILVFLQGVGEISQAKTIIEKITRGMRLRLLPLHGGLQPKDQLVVFRKSVGEVKVILSTNVAETSITIPDCTVVIDSCREKQSSFDPVNRMPLLLDQFASKASLKQRRGRAGRVREGKCFKLISQATFDKLNDHTAPEISRCALDQTLLSLLFLGVEDGTGNFMQRLLDPPGAASLKSASMSLQKLGAVEPYDSTKFSLTPLGCHLAGIPAPPTIGKLLVMGCILGCRSGGIAMASALSAGRSPLLRIDMPRNDDDEFADRNRKILKERAKVMEQCGNSDHAYLATLFMTFQRLETGGGKRKRYCEEMGLAFNGMRDIAQLANQYDSSLSSSGFKKTSTSDKNEKSWRVLRTCAVASMAPDQLVKVIRPSTKYQDTAEGARLKDGEAKGHKFFIRSDTGESIKENSDERWKEERVFMHPSSALFSVGNYNCPWLVFHSMIRTSKPFLRDATECSSYSLLLFGGSIIVAARNNVILVDNYVKLSANARIGALVKGLREQLNTFLTAKIEDPSTPMDEQLMEVIIRLLITDGLG